MLTLLILAVILLTIAILVSALVDKKMFDTIRAHGKILDLHFLNFIDQERVNETRMNDCHELIEKVEKLQEKMLKLENKNLKVKGKSTKRKVNVNVIKTKK